MTEDRQRYVEVRDEAETARASRSDTHSDWSTTLGANYTYRLYLLTMSRLCCLLTNYVLVLFARLLLYWRSSAVRRRSLAFRDCRCSPRMAYLTLSHCFPLTVLDRCVSDSCFHRTTEKNTYFVVSVRKLAFASSVTVVEFNCCKTEGNHESSC